MINIISNVLDFISSNSIPPDHKILISLIIVAIFSIIIFNLSWILNELKSINILNIKKYNIKNEFFWVTGSILLQFILIATKIINYNILSFLVVSMIWDKIYLKIFNQTKDAEIINLETIESNSEE